MSSKIMSSTIMTSKIKTTLLAGALALAAFGGAQSAQAGGRHYMPFGPFNSYAADAYDDDYEYYNGCGDCGSGYLGDAEGTVAATAKQAARRYLGVDLEDVIDEVAE